MKNYCPLNSRFLEGFSKEEVSLFAYFVFTSNFIYLVGKEWKSYSFFFFLFLYLPDEIDIACRNEDKAQLSRGS